MVADLVLVFLNKLLPMAISKQKLFLCHRQTERKTNEKFGIYFQIFLKGK